jgi:hypothetical protein
LVLLISDDMDGGLVVMVDCCRLVVPKRAAGRKLNVTGAVESFKFGKRMHSD